MSTIKITWGQFKKAAEEQLVDDDQIVICFDSYPGLTWKDLKAMAEETKMTDDTILLEFQLASDLSKGDTVNIVFCNRQTGKKIYEI